MIDWPVVALQAFWKLLCFSQAALLIYAATEIPDPLGRGVVAYLGGMMIAFGLLTKLDV